MAKLLAINNYHYRRGGAEVVFLEQMRLFERHGWTVAPFSMHHPKNERSPWESYFADEIEFGHDYSLLTKLKHAAQIIYNGPASRDLERLMAAFNPDVVHAHNVYHHLSPSVLATARQAGLPVFLTLHDLKLVCPAYSMISHGQVCEDCRTGGVKQVMLKRCMKGSLALSSLIWLESAVHRMLDIYGRSVDRFVVPSRFFIDKFVEWGWPRERFVHVPNFADVGGLTADAPVGQPFLYFGRLSREKGLYTLIEAASRAGVPLRIAGSGPDEAALKARVAELGADVTFLGFRTGDDLWREVRGCRALVLPSEWYENAPISVLEAYALGKPVIGARIGGIPEMIMEEATGLLFESGSVDALTDALVRVQAMADGQVRAWGMNGRDLLDSEYAMHRHVERLTALYAASGAPTA
ncbi:MAG: glycosyltransferase [Azonexus sp.]|nr:glycosyltransferase [Azonexus sp.]